jgi:hypothetical protein
MTQLTNYSELIGKTIKSFPYYPTSSSELVIFFTDNTFAILNSDSDMDSGLHANFFVNNNITNFQSRELGFITEEKWLELEKEERKQQAIDQLAWLKKDYPELFK